MFILFAVLYNNPNFTPVLNIFWEVFKSFTTFLNKFAKIFIMEYVSILKELALQLADKLKEYEKMLKKVKASEDIIFNGKFLEKFERAKNEWQNASNEFWGLFNFIRNNYPEKLESSMQ